MTKLIFHFLSLAISCSLAFAQETAPPIQPIPPVTGSSTERLSDQALEALAASLAETGASLEAAQQRGDTEAADRLKLRMENLTSDLERVATGQDSRTGTIPAPQPFDLVGELTDLLEPLVEELKSATKGSRDISELRAQIASHRSELQAAINALDRLNSLGGQIGSELPETLATPLEKLSSNWETRRRSAETALSVATYKLAELEAERGNVIDSLSGIFSSFFQTRGLNILLAAAAAAGTWIVLRWIWSKLENLPPFRKKKDRTFSSRAAGVLFLVGSTLAAAIVSLMVLYLAGDWVLLGLSFLFILGIVWAGKTTLPRFLDQMKLMLNLGAVREGERVVIGGVPWEVKRLNLFSELANPALEGGTLRLPIREILPLTSRPYSPKEPWFPCGPGDWVKFGERDAGKVVIQTPEWVQLILLGGSRKTFATADFIAANPESLSHNFRIRSLFGIDYAHQAIATTTVPEIFTTYLRRGLAEEVGEENVLNVSVEFASAGPSSLDYEVLADFAGESSSNNDRLQRTVQRLCVDACNENGWGIPFTQITLHQA